MAKLIVTKVDGVCWEGGILNTFILSKGTEPLFAPSMYLLHLAKTNKLDKTIATYANALKQFFKVVAQWKTGKADWKKIGDREISGYLFGYLKQQRNLSNRSIKVHIAALDGFFNWAYEHGFAINKPNFSYTFEDADTEKYQGGHDNLKLNQEYMNKPDFEQLLTAVKATNPFINERNCLVLRLGYFCGLRAFETTKPENLNTQVIREKIDAKPIGSAINIEISGKGNKVRTIIIPPRLVEDIDYFINGRRKQIPDGPLICSLNGSALNEQFASTVFKTCCTEMVEKEWNCRSFHSLRKSYATNLVAWCYENKLDPWVYVPERMGHADVNTTKQYVFFDAVLHQRHEVMRRLSLEGIEIKHYGKKSPLYAD